MPAARRAPAGPGVTGYGDLATSFILIAPLFLAYEIGVMFSSTINGVDFVTRLVYAAAGHSRRNYLLLHLLLAIGLVVYVSYLRRRRRVDAEMVVQVLLESAIYALTLGTFIVFVMQRVLGFSIADSGDELLGQLSFGTTGQAVVMSLGAGVHEELIFRLGAMAGGAALLVRAGLDRRAALVLALIVSAVVFSAAHHMGAQGESFEVSVFVYRAMAGLIFGAIFYYRSLAHAVYTHFLYDVYVLVLR
ncbi:MAG TPA: CPBP family intramembrane glutamic endopeptidase [Kofleriaceae bacterium]|nr:CPBP family intramembrane glutamic endopeptidase [Kofleriaceae bacterium]